MTLTFTIATPSGDVTMTVADRSIDRAFGIVTKTHPNWQAIGIVIQAPAGIGSNGSRNKTN